MNARACRGLAARFAGLSFGLLLLAPAAATAQVGCPFFPVPPVPVGQGPQGIAAGEFNSVATDVELVVACPVSNEVRLLQTSGIGYAPLVTLPVAGQPFSVAVGNLNGDGLNDFVSANLLGDNITVFLRTGVATFTQATFPAGDGPRAVVVANMNNAGGDDIVVANFNSDTVTVFLNNGAGGFGATTTIGSFGDGPIAIAAADFDAANGTDVAVACRNSGTVRILLNNGAGTLTLGNEISLGAGSAPVAIGAAQLNAGAPIDLMVGRASPSGVNMLVGTGGANFSVRPTIPTGDVMSLRLGQLVDSSLADAAITVSDPGAGTYSVHTLQNLGANNFSTLQIYGTQAAPSGVVLFDADNDTDLDIAVSNTEDDTISILRNKPQPGAFASYVFSDAGTEPEAVAFGDFNGDFEPDVAIANIGSDDVSVFLNLDDGRMAPEFRVTAGVDPSGIAIGRIDADAFGDLLVTNLQTDDVSLLRWDDANQDFFPRVQIPVGDGPCGVALADLDGDTDLDAVVSLRNADQLRVLINTGGTLVPGVSLGVSASPRGVAIGQLDGIGGPDIAAVCAGGSVVSVYLANAGGPVRGDAGPYTFLGNFETGGEPRAVIIADLDGDTDNDIATANFVADSISFIRNAGGAVFDPQVQWPAGDGPTGLAAGRINAEPGLDLVVSCANSDTAEILINDDNQGVFLRALSLPGRGAPSAVALTDLDNDNRDDMALASRAAATLAIVVNLGFVPDQSPAVSQQPTANPGTSIAAGTVVQVSATATGGQVPYFYRWRKAGTPIFNGTPISGTGTPNLVFNTIRVQDAGVYDVVITDACGKRIQSDPITLVVTSAGDTDGDGIPDANDNCPTVFNVNQQNSDSDTLGDACDNCPLVTNQDQADFNGDNQGDVCDDSDGDGVLDSVDNCRTTANADQADFNNDNQGDACDDTDGDGVFDNIDNCRLTPNADQSNSDADTFGNACDNCPNVTNQDQADSNMNGTGDACEATGPDADNDGVPDSADNCPNTPNTDQADGDGDNVGDACDNCPAAANPGQENSDGQPDAGDACECTCPGDANDSGAVSFGDITTVLANFGNNYGSVTGLGDANCDGVVAFIDITTVLANFGTTCTSRP
jgi:hypothetical protein